MWWWEPETLPGLVQLRRYYYSNIALIFDIYYSTIYVMCIYILCTWMTAIYAPKSVVNALFWRIARSSIVVLVWCLKSILGYTIYSVIYGYFQGMYTIYCGVLVSVAQWDYLCILYSFVGCFCVCCIVGLFVDKLLVWYLFCD